MATLHCEKVELHESGSHSVMALLQEKAQCVLWYVETKSVVIVQRNFRQVYQKDAPADKYICIYRYKWYQRFKETGNVLKEHSPGRPGTSQDDSTFE
jgi:hypothetical protein